MNVIHYPGHPERFSVVRCGVSVSVSFDRYSKSFQLLYLNPSYNSRSALHLVINTIPDAEALRAALDKAITHAKATVGVSVPSGKTFSQEDADGGKKG